MDKKNKIAIVVYTLKSGGLERVVSNQTFLFTSLGYEVDLFVLENKIDYPFDAKLHVYDLKSDEGLINKIKKYFKIKKDIQKGNYDFVLDHRYRLNNFMEQFWLNIIYKNQHLLYFIHSADFTSYINKKWAYKPNIQFISVSKGIENTLISLYPKINIQTIYNYVETSKINIRFEEIDEDFILAVGRMDESNVKQFDVLIDCYAKSILPQKNIKLLILGSGFLLNNLKQQVIDLGLEKFIVFKGFHSNLDSFYINAKSLILSSKYEGLPTVLIESLLCETPVISFDCDFGPNEIIQNEVNGLLVENQNKEKLIQAMNLFISDDILYLNCKQNAKKSVFKFTKQAIMNDWLAFFNDKQ